MASQIDALHFTSEAAAYEDVEALLWPTGPVCPHCSEAAKIGRLTGKTARPGLRKCYRCLGQFTVKIGTIFEDSHAPLRLWLQAVYLMCSSKKGVSTRQLQRTLGVGMKTAWHMGHRIRLAMAAGGGQLGGADAQAYRFQADVHESVDHSAGEYVCGDVHTNTAEGFFSVCKRGLVGVYQHMDKRHLGRYLSEFDFRMNTRAKLGVDDVQRAAIAVRGAAGKRPTYKAVKA